MTSGCRITCGVLASALLAGAALAVFSSGSAIAQERQLKVWFGRQDFIPDDQFKTFMQDYPDIAVQYEVIRLEDASAQLILALRAGNAPDILQIYERDAIQLARGGVLKDVSHLIETFKERFPETYEQLAPITWQAVTDEDGKMYGASLFNMSIYLTYRKDWLEEAGVELPLETTDQVLEAARKMSTLDEGGDRMGMTLVGCCVSPTWELPLFRAMGGEYVDYVPQIDTEVGIEWISFYQTLMRDKSAHPDTPSWDSGQMRAAFIGERAGIMNEGEHIFVEMHKQVPYETGKWGFARLPHRAGHADQHVQTGFGFPYVVTVGNQDEEAALLALEYLARPEIAKQVAIRYQPTSNTAVSQDPEYQAAKPWATEIAPLAAKLDPLPSHPTRQIQLSDILIELRDRMVADPNADPAALAKEYQQNLDAAAGG
jgi:ABC-type glycerol-3-phosphate transport system substrate-binding protein